MPPNVSNSVAVGLAARRPSAAVSVSTVASRAPTYVGPARSTAAAPTSAVVGGPPKRRGYRYEGVTRRDTVTNPALPHHVDRGAAPALSPEEEQERMAHPILKGLNHDHMIDRLKVAGWVTTERVEVCMRDVDRAHFVPRHIRRWSYVDEPQPIGLGSTISQPSIHALCLESIQDAVFPGATVLDVGVGSGYMTACLAMLAGPGGLVVGIDVWPSIVKHAVRNIRRWGRDELIKTMEISVGDGTVNPGHRLYDVIHVGAAAKEVPDALLRQLRPGGSLIMPVGKPGRGPKQYLTVFRKDAHTGRLTQTSSVRKVNFVALVRTSQSGVSQLVFNGKEWARQRVAEAKRRARERRSRRGSRLSRLSRSAAVGPAAAARGAGIVPPIAGMGGPGGDGGSSVVPGLGLPPGMVPASASVFAAGTVASSSRPGSAFITDGSIAGGSEGARGFSIAPLVDLRQSKAVRSSHHDGLAPAGGSGAVAAKRIQAWGAQSIMEEPETDSVTSGMTPGRAAPNDPFARTVIRGPAKRVKPVASRAAVMGKDLPSKSMPHWRYVTRGSAPGARNFGDDAASVASSRRERSRKSRRSKRRKDAELDDEALLSELMPQKSAVAKGSLGKN